MIVIPTHVMLLSDECALMPWKISVAMLLPRCTRLNDSLTSKGHEDIKASQNDVGSLIDGTSVNSDHFLT